MTLTYHNDPELKKWFVAETIWHREQDLLLAGGYNHHKFDLNNGSDVSEFKGCAIGCAVLSLKRSGKLNGVEYNSHKDVAKALGWPLWLCYLQDKIFEGLPLVEREKWTEKLAKAVPVGKDISKVEDALKIKIQERNLSRAKSLPEYGSKQSLLNAITAVIDSIKTGDLEVCSNVCSMVFRVCSKFCRIHSNS